MDGLGNKEIMARNIQYYMNKFGKERKDVCADLGFKYTTFCDWVNGKKYPRIDKIELMAGYFGIAKSDLVEEKSHQEIKPNVIDARTKNLLELYMSLNDEDKNEILSYAEFKIQAYENDPDLRDAEEEAAKYIKEVELKKTEKKSYTENAPKQSNNIG